MCIRDSSRARVRNPMRAALTILGIIIGIAAVIAMAVSYTHLLFNAR